MKPLSAHRVLHLAAHAVPILKHLAMTNTTMTLKEFGQALGIVAQAWKSGHHDQITSVLKVIEIASASLNTPQLELHRITRPSRPERHRYCHQWIETRER